MAFRTLFRRFLPAAYLPLVLASFWAGQADAATPEKIRVSQPDSSRGVDISTSRDVVALETALCSPIEAGDLSGRLSLDILVQWTEDFTWSGKLYPSTEASPAAIDVPAWKLYGDSEQPDTCRSRVVGRPALRVLRRYGIPTTVGHRFPASDNETGWVVVATIGGAGLLMVVLVARRVAACRRAS
jgi:hypothetical protein